MKFTAAGDAIIQKNIPKDYKYMEELREFISRGDVRFFNLETTLNEPNECFASQFSGATYLRTTPKVLEDLKEYSFNCTSFNNNHCMDFSYDGFTKTLDSVKESGLVQAGSGRSLDEAAMPGYVETPNGKAALISVNTSFEPCAIAGNEAKGIKSRPGINGLNIEEIVLLPADEFEQITHIADKTEINEHQKIIAREGYATLDKEGELSFGKTKFLKGEKAALIQRIAEKDLNRVKKAINEAKKYSEEIIISIHSHNVSGASKENVPKFLQDFAHMCIDEGATAIIGHGPHLLRPIEVYKECPIFYSLGDFILQLYDVEYAPVDFYEKYDVLPEKGVHELLKTRSKNFTIGLMEQRIMFQTVIPYWERENRKLKCLELLPVELSMHEEKKFEGLPRIAKNDDFMQHLAELSEPFGVKIMQNGNVYSVTW